MKPEFETLNKREKIYTRAMLAYLIFSFAVSIIISLLIIAVLIKWLMV